jgi:hypothetical protein
LTKLLKSALYHVIWPEFAEQQTTTGPVLFSLDLTTKKTGCVTQPQLSVYNFVFAVKQAYVPKMQGIFGRQKVEKPRCSHCLWFILRHSIN